MEIWQEREIGVESEECRDGENYAGEEDESGERWWEVAKGRYGEFGGCG